MSYYSPIVQMWAQDCAIVRVEEKETITGCAFEFVNVFLYLISAFHVPNTDSNTASDKAFAPQKLLVQLWKVEINRTTGTNV